MTEWLGFPINAAAHGAALDRMTGFIHWGMAAMAVGWGVFFVYVLFKFRAGRHPEAIYQGAKGRLSTASEVAVIVAEVALLVVFAIPTWANWVRLPGPEASALEVRMVGEQFAWNFHYPGPDRVFGRTKPELMNSNNPVGLDPSDPAAADDFTTINQLNVQVDRPVVVHLMSKDVIHSFGIPVMRVKQDAIPGLSLPVHFTPVMTNPPDAKYPACAAKKSCWEIACAQLCGLGHFRMRGFINVHTAEEFAAWTAAQAPQPAAPAAPAAPAEPAPAEAAPPATGT